MSVTEHMHSLLGDHGPLAESIPSFSPRPAQQQMAASIEETLEQGDVLVCEAGTGTGKTFAYLVPALSSERKIVISTGTKTLQDQLFLRDLPLVSRALAASRRCAMLKGRSNYLCPHRLEQAVLAGGFRSHQQQDQLQRIRAWFDRSEDGDIAGMRDIAEDAPIWFQVTSTTDNCLGQDCPELSVCPVMKARRAAQEADVLVINHYLLFSDMMLRDQGFGDLLPGVDALILDEAHQIPDIASDFFGQTLSSRQLTELANDSETEYLRDAGDMPAFRDALRRLERGMTTLRQAMGSVDKRFPLRVMLGKDDVRESMSCLRDELDYVRHMLESLASRGKGLDSCWRRSDSLLQKMDLFLASDNEEHIFWCETSRRGFVLHETPIEIAGPFREHMQSYDAAWVFTSATLSVDNSFNHFTQRLGIAEPRTERWDSPFDFQRNACLYLPTEMPEPASRNFVASVVDRALPVIHACKGRTFMLFTSYRALHEAARLMKSHKLDFPLLVQGDAPRNELLRQFRSHGNAILLGTGSFWEGVDVRGDALSCVIIDKLPFATPDDPVLQARAELMTKKGGNPFRDYQLPNAIISLKQGLGRLIRDQDDRGIMMLCDPRITSRSYGRIFLHNLPTMKTFRELDDVIDFFASVSKDQGGVDEIDKPVAMPALN